MTRGKKTCKILKEIRREIAKQNDIEYITQECGFKGECKGTCPKCEAELRYLENELRKRRQLGKAVTIAGISLGMAGALAACDAPKQNDATFSQDKALEKLAGKMATSKDTLGCKTDTIANYIAPDIGVMTTVGLIEIAPPPPEVAGVRTIDIEGDIAIPEPEIMGKIVAPPSDQNQAYDWVPEMPTFPGGDAERLKFLKENLQYPEKDAKAGTQGTVYIQFTVTPSGKLTDFKVVRSVSQGLDAEALRIAKLMPDWNPGRQNGEAVYVSFKMPVKFKLEQ